jgi:hypothetical protein
MARAEYRYNVSSDWKSGDFPQTLFARWFLTSTWHVVIPDRQRKPLCGELKLFMPLDRTECPPREDTFAACGTCWDLEKVVRK